MQHGSVEECRAPPPEKALGPHLHVTIPTSDQVQQGHADPGRLLQECKTDLAEIDWDPYSQERYDVVGSLSGELIFSHIYGKNDLDWDDCGKNITSRDKWRF